jgi:hypothetical protein
VQRRPRPFSPFPPLVRAPHSFTLPCAHSYVTTIIRNQRCLFYLVVDDDSGLHPRPHARAGLRTAHPTATRRYQSGAVVRILGHTTLLITVLKSV